jgi:uncharacterized Zn finger protein
MPSVDDLLNEKTLMGLAPPREYVDGAAAAEHGAVRVLEHDEAHLRAEVEDTQVYVAELHVQGSGLAWSCSCGEAVGHLCRHLVAAALATWPDEVPEEEGD